MEGDGGGERKASASLSIGSCPLLVILRNNSGHRVLVKSMDFGGHMTARVAGLAPSLTKCRSYILVLVLVWRQWNQGCT